MDYKDNRNHLKQTYRFPLLFALAFISLSSGCISHPLKGLTPDGNRVYLGSLPIENTEAYKTFRLGPPTETEKLFYLLNRVKDARDVTYRFEDGWYTYFEAYPAALWLLVHHYERGETARFFIHKEFVAFHGVSESTTMHFPNGSYHLAYYVFLNELDLLEETLKREM
ncbi:MAG: hypothetical protein HY583_00975 [Candidatus Omnitrophica bacterium]|nr:hypothetical protein [Candidatus Omnitrophota bacterium]